MNNCQRVKMSGKDNCVSFKTFLLCLLSLCVCLCVWLVLKNTCVAGVMSVGALQRKECHETWESAQSQQCLQPHCNGLTGLTGLPMFLLSQKVAIALLLYFFSSLPKIISSGNDTYWVFLEEIKPCVPLSVCQIIWDDNLVTEWKEMECFLYWK